MLTRDRRWCAGNLQHFWFLFARGIEMGNRLQIWIGLMAYLSSPVWLAFLVAGSLAVYDRARFMALSAGPEELGAPLNSGPPFLFIMTMVLLFSPRLLGLITTLPRASEFGGVGRLLISALLETLFSVLMAPVLMLFHTIFVALTLLGWQLKWTSQNRADTGLSLSHCLKLYGWQSILGLTSLSVAVIYLSAGSVWLMPIFLAWILAPLTAWISSWRSLGLLCKSFGLFIIPEESAVPAELKGLDEASEPAKTSSSIPLWPQALLSPYIMALHLSMVRQRLKPRREESPTPWLIRMRERLVKEGPSFLSAKEKMRLLWDSETVFWLYRELWSRPEPELHSSWRGFQNESSRDNLFLT
jgi:membrane glycosyltransferase